MQCAQQQQQQQQRHQTLGRPEEEDEDDFGAPQLTLADEYPSGQSASDALFDTSS
jgi:hypothetical protein